MKELNSRRLDLIIIGIVVLFLGSVIGVATTLIKNGRRDALAIGSEQTGRVVSSVEAAINHSFLSIDVMLADMRHLIVPAMRGNRGLDLHIAHQLLRAAANQSLVVRHVSLLSPQGAVIVTSSRNGRETGPTLPEGFLEEVAAQRVPALVISTPTLHLSTSTKALYFARPVTLVDGRRIVAVAEVQTSQLADLMAQGVNINGLELTLEQADGSLLASMPANEVLLGTRMWPLGFTPAIEGTAHEVLSRISRVPALLTARQTLYRNTIVVAGIPTETVLSGWRSQRQSILTMSAVFSAMILIAGGVARWYLRRLRQARSESTRARQTLDQAMESMVSGFLLVDAEGRVRIWNQRLLEIYPWLRDLIAPELPFRAVVSRMAEAMLPDGSDADRQAWEEQRLDLHRQASGEHEFYFPGGLVTRLSERRTPDKSTVCVLWDVTDQKKVEVELRIAATAFDSHEGIIITDARSVILRVNKSFTEATGYTAQEVIGKTPRLLKSGRHDQSFYEAMWKQLNATGAWHGEIWNRRKNNEIYPEWMTITAVKGDGQNVTHYVGTLIDISARKTAEEEIHHLAFYDSLTGLPNRRMLIDRLQRALATSARTGQNGALLLIDLDNFKSLNDALGHDIGDLLLQQVAQRLVTCLREADTVARLGGDEFVLILEDLSEDARLAVIQTETIAEKILSVLIAPYLLSEHEFISTPSIGVTLFAEHRDTPEGLLKRADIAMYQAKKAGRNAIRFFDPDMQTAVESRAAIERGMIQALAQNQFLLYYQPQVDHTGRIHGAEALLRWQHPDKGMISPAEFIPLAEENGAIVRIGLWVLETACAQLRCWQDDPAKCHLQLAVNVSARQFRQSHFADEVIEVVQKHAINPRRLKLELTESTVLDNIPDTIAKMQALKAIGVIFSMDDFGTGQSSLSNLKKLPLDQIKIDQGFVSELTADADDAIIVQTIIALADNLGMEVIAEGVETEEQRQGLIKRGCLHLQGYLFGKPASLQDFEAMLERSLA